MTIWQKRLLIFGAKVSGVIIVLIVIALFLYYHFYFKKDNLMKYVPQNAVLYSTFRLNNDIKDNQVIKKALADLEQNYNWPEIEFNLLNNFVGYNGALAVIPNLENNDLKFDYLLIFNLKKNIKVYNKYLNLIQQYDLHYNILTNQTLERNILVVSNSDKVIEEINKIMRQEKPALVDRVDVVLNLDKYKINYFGKVFIDINALTNKVNKIKSLKFKLLLTSFKANKQKNLYLGIKQDKGKIIVTNLAENINLAENNYLLNKIPEDFVLNFMFEQGKDKFMQIEKNLADLDSVVWQNLTNQKDYYEGMLNFDLENDILELFNNQAQYIKIGNNQFFIAINLPKDDEIELKLAKIEQIIKEYIALSNPIIESKQLPDKTYIRQIVKNRANFNFENEEIGANFSLKSIKYKDLEYAYFISENRLYLANSRQIINDLIENINLINIKDIECENMTNFSENLLLKGEYLANYSQLLTNLNNLVIKYTPDSNSQFWLCLD